MENNNSDKAQTKQTQFTHGLYALFPVIRNRGSLLSFVTSFIALL